MKLYATTTSERASKGQGGEWLNITITDENKREIAKITAETLKNNYLLKVETVDGHQSSTNNYFQKLIGKKQKGDNQ